MGSNQQRDAGADTKAQFSDLKGYALHNFFNQSKKNVMSDTPVSEIITKLLRFTNESTYQNNGKSWSRIVFRDETGGRITVIDTSNAIPTEPLKGVQYEVTGYEEEHPKFGMQLKVVSISEFIEKDEKSILRWLSSGALPGIGRIHAPLIFKALGLDAKDLIDTDPACLKKVAGLDTKLVDSCIKDLLLTRGAGLVRADLMACGISPAKIERVISHFEIKTHDEAKQFLSRIEVDPFCLARVPSVSIDDAKLRASRCKGPIDPLSYPKAALLNAVCPSNDGDLGVTISEAAVYLSSRVSDGTLQLKALEALKKSGDIVEVMMPSLKSKSSEPVKHLFLTSIFDREVEVAKKLKEKLYYHNTPFQALSDSALSDLLGDGSVITHTGKKVSLAEGQLAAVKKSLTSSVSVITGGPGTGKTTILRAIVDVYTKAGLKVIGMAPSGKASERASRSFTGTDLSFSTMHMALGLTPDGWPEVNADKPLEADLVVLDESSMTDAEINAFFIAAVSQSCSIIYLGDVEQLPSVGPGCVLRDLIDSGVVPVSRLEKIQRVVEGSDVLRVISSIQAREVPVMKPALDGTPSTVFLVDTLKAEHYEKRIQVPPKTSSEDVYALHKMVSAIEYFVEKRGVKPEEIAVYVPTNKGLLGTQSLNFYLQKVFNPHGLSLKVGLKFEDGTVFELRKGDRVMRIVSNDHKKMVFNGQEGVAISCTDNVLKVKFQNRDDIVEFPKAEWKYLTPSYASSVHKAQGSEARCVITTMLESCPIPLRQYNMVLTAYSRTSEFLVSIHNGDVLKRALQNCDSMLRTTLLTKLLQDLDVRPPRLKIDPAAGMYLPPMKSA